MAVRKKAASPDFIWADLVPLLQRYYTEEEAEFFGWVYIFQVWQSLRYIDLNDLAEHFVIPTEPLTVSDFVDQSYKEKCWQYGLAQVYFEHCEEY